jgi:hypothetical protein
LYAVIIDLGSNAISEMAISHLYPTKILKFYLLVIVTPVSLYLLFSFLKKGNPEELIKSFFWIISIQFTISIVMLLNGEIRDYINFSFLIPEEKIATDIDELYSMYNYRGGYGLASEQLFGYPLFNAWIACVSFFSYIKKNLYYYVFFIPISLIPAILNARVALVFFPIFIFSFLLIEKEKILNLGFILKVFFSLSFFAFLMILSYIQFINYIPEQSYFWIASGFFDILNIFSFGAINIQGPASSFGSSGPTSETLLSSHLFFPDNFISLLIGENRYIFGNQFSSVSSDIGYIRLIFFGGIIFLIAIIFVFIGFLLKIMSKTKNKIYQGILTSGILMILIGNIKGLAFESNALLRGIFLFAIFVLLDPDVNNIQHHKKAINKHCEIN